MSPTEFNSKLISLVGKPVTQATVAGNTPLLWLGAPPKAAEAICLWLDPPWRITRERNFHVGSAEFPWRQEDFESEAEYKAELERVCALCKRVEGQTIERVVYDPQTADLELSLSGGLHFRSFATAGQEEHWHLSEYSTSLQYRVCPGIISVEALDP